MKRLEKFKDFKIVENEHSNLMRSRRDEADKKSIDYMLNNAILFQRMKLTKQMEDLEKELIATQDARDNDHYVKADPNPETNPVALEYEEKIDRIITTIAELKEKIEKVKS